jgi:hypothetical protein
MVICKQMYYCRHPSNACYAFLSFCAILLADTLLWMTTEAGATVVLPLETLGQAGDVAFIERNKRLLAVQMPRVEIVGCRANFSSDKPSARNAQRTGGFGRVVKVASKAFSSHVQA